MAEWASLSGSGVCDPEVIGFNFCQIEPGARLFVYLIVTLFDVCAYR